MPRRVNWQKLRADEAEWLIRQRAKEDSTENVIFTDHAWDRIEERDITREDVFRILRSGRCVEAPQRNEKGHWQVIVSKRLQGSREAGAVTIILEDSEKLIIRTVQWMDVR